MATMIPPTIGPETVSKGEREIYAKLRDDPATRDWTVLHSLDIAKHDTQVEGEADFVVLVPGKGVLILEVKACVSYRTDRGLWYYGSDTRGKRTSPFKQAAMARRSLQKAVLDYNAEFRSVPFWSAVIFPYCKFTEKPVEWHAWQAIDYLTYERQPISRIVLDVLDRARDHLARTTTATWFRKAEALPTSSQCEAIAQLLRPKFEYFMSPSQRLDQLDAEVRRYTEEQFSALRAMQDNPQVIFYGPAGTGKTILALEAARRAAQDGHKVLLLVFNRLLGRWLEDQARPLAPLVTVKTINQYMLGLTGLTPPTGAGDAFWLEILPTAALEKLLERSDPEYDILIVDEAQDLTREVHLDVMDQSLKGHLQHGRWMFFGDFERQTIYGPATALGLKALKKKGDDASLFALRTNCRNTLRIVEYAQVLGALVPGYDRVLRREDPFPPRILSFKTPAEQAERLVEALTQLLHDGFTGENVVILAPTRDGIASSIRGAPWQDRLAPYEEARKGQIRYTTIQAFKGLEAPAVVVTDIHTVKSEQALDLLYIAITRACHRLILLVDEQAKAELQHLLIQRFAS